MARYANILTSLAVESGDGGHQEIIDCFLEYNMDNFFIKEMFNSSNIKKQCRDKSHAGLKSRVDKCKIPASVVDEPSSDRNIPLRITGPINFSWSITA